MFSHTLALHLTAAAAVHLFVFVFYAIYLFKSISLSVFEHFVAIRFLVLLLFSFRMPYKK